MTQVIDNQLKKRVSCHLCGLEVHEKRTHKTQESFCCSGCEMVYQILKAKGEVETFDQSEIYKEALKFGIISNPELQDKEKKSGTEETYKVYLELDGLLCPACAQVIHLVMMKKKGVRRCDVDYSTDLAIIEYEPKNISRESIEASIKKLGYGIAFLDSDEKKQKGRPLLARLGVAFFCSMNIMTLSSFIYAEALLGTSKAYIYAILSAVFCLPIIFYAATPFLKVFFKRITVGYFGMETLISISIIAASTYSFWSLAKGSHEVYFDSLSMIVSLVLLGKHLEWKAKSNSKLALLSLHKTLPKKARKVSLSGDLVEVYVKDIQLGDYLFASPGEKIVADGQVVEGEAHVDESLLTGEALPKRKIKETVLIAGSHLKSGSITYQVKATPEKSTLAKILSYIEAELAKGSPKYRFVDRVTRYFVPTILCFATCVGLGMWMFGAPTQTVFERFLSILLISCPCAIGIAAPLVESLARKKLSESGILVKAKNTLTQSHASSTWIFDKTGTITEGKFRITNGLEHLSEKERSILKGLSVFSKHPLSKAVSEELKEQEYPSLTHLTEEVGLGVYGFYDDTRFILGSKRYVEKLGHSVQERSSTDALETVLYFANDQKILTELCLQDQLREGVLKTLQQLPAKDLILLSGDQNSVVKKIARLCRIKKAYGETNPLEKQELIKKLRTKEHTIFVGDGINDAPALAAAHTGVAVYSAQDISLQVADVLLTEDKLSSLPMMTRVIDKTIKITKQNTFWSFFYNSLGVACASLGYLKPLYAASIMVSSSIIIILNSLKVKKC